MADPVVPFDVARMFLGPEPPLFYLEILFRTCVIYSYALLMIRWVGGRGIAQMSTVEFLLVIALGSAVGDAMFYPDVPLLHAMATITVVVVINKALDWVMQRSQRVSKAIDGVAAEVVRDGVVNSQALRDSNLGKSDLFMSLRQQGFCNLGEVRRAYLETSGKFSIFRAKPPRVGLAVEPAWDITPPPVYQGGAGDVACGDCGAVTAAPPPAVCGCGCKVWMMATTPDC